MSKRLRRKSTPGDRGYTQTVVPEPSFRRGVASIVDIRGKLFLVNPKGGRVWAKTAAAALRSDQKRVAGDFAAVRPHDTELVAAKVEAALKS